MPRYLSDEQVQKAAEMLGRGDSFAETSRATGISLPTLYKRFRKSGDAKPAGNSKASKRTSATDEQLTSLFTKIAVAPSLPMGLWLHCDFCANHFVQNGPDAATQLVQLSKDQPALRNVMEMVWRWGQEAAWATLLVTWLGVPIAHHMAPDFIYRWLQLPLGLPPRLQPTPHTHGPREQPSPMPQANGNVDRGMPPQPEAATFPTPFGNMDTDQLIATAKAFGMDVTGVEDVLKNATTPEPSPQADTNGTEPAEPDIPADTDTAPVETTEADTDTG